MDAVPSQATRESARRSRRPYWRIGELGVGMDSLLQAYTALFRETLRETPHWRGRFDLDGPVSS